MKHLNGVALAAAIIFLSTSAYANVIERACNASDRDAANRSLCACIQYAADRTLSRRDQKEGAKFFRDPHAAQEMRQSDRRSHEKFWKRWRNFGETAEAMCS